MAALSRRIVKETMRLLQEPVPGISAVPDENNARYFHVIVTGPSDSPFEGGLFKLELFLPEDYPMSAPKVRFITKIYHPNIDRLGRICLDILKDKWSPALQIRTVLLSIQALLSAPNPGLYIKNIENENKSKSTINVLFLKLFLRWSVGKWCGRTVEGMFARNLNSRVVVFILYRLHALRASNRSIIYNYVLCLCPTID